MERILKDIKGLNQNYKCNNNNNVHLSRAHERPERSHDTY